MKLPPPALVSDVSPMSKPPIFPLVALITPSGDSEKWSLVIDSRLDVISIIFADAFSIETI